MNDFIKPDLGEVNDDRHLICQIREDSGDIYHVKVNFYCILVWLIK